MERKIVITLCNRLDISQFAWEEREENRGKVRRGTRREARRRAIIGTRGWTRREARRRAIIGTRGWTRRLVDC